MPISPKLRLDVLSKGGELRVSLRQKEEDEHRLIKEFSVAADSTESFGPWNADPGQYLIGLSGEGSYRLQVSQAELKPDLDIEPNEDWDQALLLVPGVEARGRLNPSGDVDWYRVDTVENRHLFLLFSAPGKDSVVLELFQMLVKAA